MKPALAITSLFLLAAGSWLLIMENILKHDGYAARSLVAACIAIQGLATLLFVVLKTRSAFRYLIMTGAVAALLLGGGAVTNIVRAQHFEGFVVLIGLALLLQGALTLATLLRTPYRQTA